MTVVNTSIQFNIKSCRILKSKFKEFSRTTQGLRQIFPRKFKYRKRGNQEAQNTEAFHKFTSMIFFKLFLDISFAYFLHFFTAVNEVNSKNSIFKETFSFSKSFSSVLEKTFQIPALFKEFKDLHNPCIYNFIGGNAQLPLQSMGVNTT